MSRPRRVGRSSTRPVSTGSRSRPSAIIEGLTPWGGCRLCLVEIGVEPKTKLVSSCTYPAEEGLIVRTDTRRVIEARRMMIELMLSTAPMSKEIQDLASKFGVTRQRFEPRNEECVYCGLCVRMCAEQMDARAIGFQNRGFKRKISTPFDIRSEDCRLCGACMYVCPACAARCGGPNAETDICNACLPDRADLPRSIRRVAVLDV